MPAACTLLEQAADYFVGGLILALKTRFFSKVREDWLCRKRMPWENGVLDYWSIGFGGVRSIFK